jgi:hypothetical protein
MLIHVNVGDLDISEENYRGLLGFSMDELFNQVQKYQAASRIQVCRN